MQAEEAGGLNLLRSSSFQAKEPAAAAGGGSAGGTSTAVSPVKGGDPSPSSSDNPVREPVSISNKSSSLRDAGPVSRAQLLGGLGRGDRNDSAQADSKQSLSLKNLPDDMRARLAASQAALAAGSSNSDTPQRARLPPAQRPSPVVAERSFSF